MARQGEAYELARPPRQTFVVGSTPSPGKLNLPAKKGEPMLSCLLDTGATVNVAGRNWRQVLNVEPGVGTDVTAVGGGRVSSVGRGTLEIVYATGGSSPGDTAHTLAGPHVSAHPAFKLHYPASSWPPRARCCLVTYRSAATRPG